MELSTDYPSALLPPHQSVLHALLVFTANEHLQFPEDSFWTQQGILLSSFLSTIRYFDGSKDTKEETEKRTVVRSVDSRFSGLFALSKHGGVSAVVPLRVTIKTNHTGFLMQFVL